MAIARTKEDLREEQKRLRGEIEKKHGKTPEQLYEERERRVRDALELREPDRVPVVTGGGYFADKYVGLPLSASYYDPLAHLQAIKKTILDFEPDVYMGLTAAGANSGPALELLNPHHTKWPGGPLPADVSHQAIEQEYMKGDEYDLFLNDPTDYTLRYLLPRAFGGLEPLGKLPALTDRFTGFPGMTPLFTREEFKKIARILLEAGQHVQQFNRDMAGFDEEMAELGFPPMNHVGGAGGAPFDSISDFYRGMRGSMVDMYKCPDKLVAACEKVLEWRIKRAVPADPKARGNPKRVFIALHRGAEGFMSKQQFEKFYWPGLKRAMLKTIELGYTVMPFCEGRYVGRLEYFLEMPKGKVACHFDLTDMKRAKEVLKDHVCIMGNVPSILFQAGSPQETEEYCKQLIKDCGKGGGFILRSGSSIDEAKPANLKAMVDSVKKYGRY